MVKLLLAFAVPPGVVNDTLPVAAPGITIPTNCVPELEMVIAATPPIEKAVGLPRLTPLMVTKVPTGPDEGLNDVMEGACASAACPANKKKMQNSSGFSFIVVIILMSLLYIHAA